MRKVLFFAGITCTIFSAAPLMAQTTGCIAGNCVNGYGAYQYDDGRYEGHFSMGIKDGDGVYAWKTGDKYDGTWVNNQMQGKGTVYFKDGTKYTGEILNGVTTENGTYYNADGSIDKTRGYGKNPQQMNAVSKGCSTGNCINGYGIYYYENSGRYEGNFVNGYRSGKGKYFWDNGEKYDGDWLNGLMDGNGIYTFADGSRYEGEMKNSVITGKGTYYFADGTIDHTRTDGTGNTTTGTKSDPFAETLLMQIEDVELDFLYSIGSVKVNMYNLDKDVTTYENYYPFDSAADNWIEYRAADQSYKAYTVFYDGADLATARRKYDELAQRMKSALSSYYTYNDIAEDALTVQGMICGMKISTEPENIPTAALKIVKHNGYYLVELQVGYDNM